MAKVSKRLRFEILRRDQYRCRYCGTIAAETELRVDHVIPEALGGTADPSNLATACEPCNNGKSSTTPDAPIVDEVAEGALRWTSALQAAAGAMEKRIRERQEHNDWFLEAWTAYHLGDDRTAKVPLPADWDGAVTRLEAAGLTHALFDEAITAAMKAYKVQAENRFRYFCGVAWNMVTDLQKAAQDIVVGDEPRVPPKPAPATGATSTVAEALDAAMDIAGILLESWQYDELVDQLAQRLVRRA